MGDLTLKILQLKCTTKVTALLCIRIFKLIRNKSLAIIFPDLYTKCLFSCVTLSIAVYSRVLLLSIIKSQFPVLEDQPESNF